MRKLVFVNQFTTQLFIDKLEAFETLGYETILFTGNDFLKKDNNTRRIINSVPYNRSNIFLRISSWVLFSLHFAVFLLLSKRDKTYIISSNPPILTGVILLVNKIRRLRYYLIIYDIYPDVLVSMKYLSAKNLIVRIWNGINKRVYDQSFGVFTISRLMANNLKGKTDCKIKIIHNWFDKNFVPFQGKNENWFASKHSLIGKRVIMYSGNLGITHKIESLLDLAKKLRDDHRYRFIIIGNGAKKKALQSEIKRCGLDNILILPLQPYEHLPYTLSAADFGVVTLDENAESVSVPSKTYYMMAAGCALFCIGSGQSELGRLVQSYDLGVIHRSNEIDKMVSFLKNLPESELNSYKINALAASRNFTSDNAADYVNYIEQNGI